MLQPLIFFFQIHFFQHSLKAAGITRKKKIFISDAMPAILDNTVKKRTTAFYMWFQVQYDFSMS